MKNKNIAARHGNKKERLSTVHEQAILKELVKQVKDRCTAINDEDFWIDFEEVCDFVNAGDYEEAMAFIAAFYKKHKRITKYCRAHLYYLKGFLLHYSKRDYKRALMYYNKAVSNSPAPEGAYYYDRGRLHEQMGNLEGKERDFEIGRKIDPVWFESE